MYNARVRAATNQMTNYTTSRHTPPANATAAQVEEMLQLDAVLRAGDVPVRYDMTAVQYLTRAQARNMIKIMKASKVKQAKGLLG